tara:strand:+ start:398 stop:1045 length:648 start_codon:yes stop_codon:yes gene_type:complete
MDNIDNWPEATHVQLNKRGNIQMYYNLQIVDGRTVLQYNSTCGGGWFITGEKDPETFIKEKLIKIKTLLWLDDIRDPHKDDWLNFSPIEQPYKVVWVKNYEEFMHHLVMKGLPEGICFDHDLSDFQSFVGSNLGWLSQQEETCAEEGLACHTTEKYKKERTGMDCARWLVDYCIQFDQELPKYNIQSANPVGKENINSLLSNFRAHQIKENERSS